jgi:hypothetical protein
VAAYITQFTNQRFTSFGINPPATPTTRHTSPTRAFLLRPIDPHRLDRHPSEWCTSAVLTPCPAISQQCQDHLRTAKPSYTDKRRPMKVPPPAPTALPASRISAQRRCMGRAVSRTYWTEAGECSDEVVPSTAEVYLWCYNRARSLSHMRREVFPLAMRFHHPNPMENKSLRQARFGLYDAQRAWCIAAQAGSKEESLEAGIRLAGLLIAQHERSQKRAQRLYGHAIDSGHKHFAPAAAFGLGILLEELAETSRAQKIV